MISFCPFRRAIEANEINKEQARKTNEQFKEILTKFGEIGQAIGEQYKKVEDEFTDIKDTVVKKFFSNTAGPRKSPLKVSLS